MKKLADIKNKNDIEHLINVFYSDVKNDEVLKPFFIKVNWEKHLPIMVNFWENVLFYSGSYSGNPMEKHKYLHQKMTMKKNHFDKWLALFYNSVDQLYFGPKANLIKERANNIAIIMQVKIID